jgi:lysyl-tRNA synthetase class 2
MDKIHDNNSVEMELNEQMLIRREKLDFYKENNVNPFANGFRPESNSHLIENNFDKYSKEELDEHKHIVSIAGRVMTKRGQGKAGFATLKDFHGNMQIYVANANISDLEFTVWNKLDLGDIVYVEGEVMKTKVGALAVRATKFVLLTKSLRPLPEKFHGLTDKEERYRRRYVDLIVNENTTHTFVARSKIIAGIRKHLNDLDYLEVETPILQTMPGGASAEPFVTHHNTLDMKMYLRIAPELYLKKLVVGGIPRVYEIGKQFRNEGMSIKHNPEFTSIEIYAMFEDMEGMMRLTENIFQEACLKTNDTLHIKYGETELDLTHFKRIHMVDMIKEVCGVDFMVITDFEEAKSVAKANHVGLEDHHTSVGHIINEFFEQKCEEQLIQPTFIYGHPVEISPLSRINEENSRFTDRFELFIDGREYANAFSELNDPIDQLNRFKGQMEERELGNAEAHEIDYDFIQSLEYGMAPTGGLGIGIDRMVMLLTNSTSIRDVIFFPTMKERK